MVRAGGVAGGRADTTIAFLDQVLVGHLFIGGITPEFLAHPFVHALGKGFGQPVCQGLDHNGAVVIVGVFELSGQFVDADAGGHRKAAHVIAQMQTLRRHEVGQRHHWLARSLLILLTQMVQGSQLFGSGLIGVHHNVITPAIGGPEPDNASCGDPLFPDHLFQ